MSGRRPGRQRRAALLLAAGLAGVAYSEWRAWQADRARPPLAPPPPLPPGPRPRVSVLVGAWREEPGHVARLLRSFAALRYPDKELVLCAGGGGTYEEAAGIAGRGVVVLEQRPGEGKWRALGRCLEQATGEIIFLTDADCALTDAAFEGTLAPLLSGEAAVATGHSAPFPDDERRSPLVAYQGDEEQYLNALRGEASFGLHGRNSVIRRSALEAAGGFSGEVRTGTDYALARRLRAAGHPVRSVAASVVPSAYHDDLRAYCRQRSRWLRNLVVHGAAAGDWSEVRHAAVTGALGAALLSGPALAALFGPVATALWVVLFAKATASRLRRHVAVQRMNGQGGGPAPRALLTPLWVLADAAAWTLFVIDLLIPSRRGRW